MTDTLTDALDADQRRALENIRAAVERIWARPLHRTFTDHTAAHSQRVIALLDGLTAGMMVTPKRLCPAEVFVLLAAAYLHDIGMQNEKFRDGDLDEIRAHHNQQTAEMIYAVFEDPAHAFRIPLTDDPGVVEAIALVAQGHRQVDLAGPEYDSLSHGSETLRLRLLAALLRFGDELDIDHRRVDLEVMKLMRLKADSQLHWWKCHYVSGVSIVDEYIRVSYRFPQSRPDYEGLIVPLVEGEIRAKLADLEGIFRDHAVKVALGPAQVRPMRLVQPLPAEVEELAITQIKGYVQSNVPVSAQTELVRPGSEAKEHKIQNQKSGIQHRELIIKNSDADTFARWLVSKLKEISRFVNISNTRTFHTEAVHFQEPGGNVFEYQIRLDGQITHHTPRKEKLGVDSMVAVTKITPAQGVLKCEVRSMGTNRCQVVMDYEAILIGTMQEIEHDVYAGYDVSPSFD